MFFRPLASIQPQLTRGGMRAGEAYPFPYRVSMKEAEAELSEITICSDQAQSVAGRGVVVIKFENEVVLVRRQSIIAASSRDFGDAQQFRHVFPGETVHTLSRGASRSLCRLCRKSASRCCV